MEFNPLPYKKNAEPSTFTFDPRLENRNPQFLYSISYSTGLIPTPYVFNPMP